MRQDFDSEPRQRGPEDAVNVFDEIPARKPPGERISSQILARCRAMKICSGKYRTCSIIPVPTHCPLQERRPRSTIAPDIKRLEPYHGKKYIYHASRLASFDGRHGKKILDPHSSQIEVESQVHQMFVN